MIARGELSIDEVFSIAVQLVSALTAAHSRGIVHRDIKPSNVFVQAGKAVKVMDFGIAVDRQSVHQGNTIAGTLRYMSPEQLKGLDPDPRSDIFSLGVVLYEMITGRKPFEGETAEALAAAIESTPPRSDQGTTRGRFPAACAVRRCLPGVRSGRALANR